ncbi:MAG TPA: FtsX-like permease family protein, partial [Gemmatimonadaceae bacterium]|nr:FtsX-like permease family protein [Gemmatimonadaceae bacterium]
MLVRLQDVRSSFARAARAFRRRPAFFAIATSSLAIALGLATTVIAQIDSLMHPVQAVREAERAFTVRLFGFGRANARPRNEDIEAALRSSGAFESVVLYGYRFEQIEVGPGVVSVSITLAGRDYMDLVGMRLRLGRLFETGETQESQVAIVTDQFWRRYFANGTSLAGATFAHQNRTYRVIGVAAPEWAQTGTDIWIPRAATRDARAFAEAYVARLRNGVAPKNAQAILTAVADRWVAALGQGRQRFRFLMWSMKTDPLHLGSFQIAMMAAALFILVIASANVSALMLARSVTNRRDQALRLALGASRRHLLQDVTAEIVIVAVAGGVAGIVIAFVAMGIMVAVTPPELGWLGFVRPNWSPRVFLGLF